MSIAPHTRAKEERDTRRLSMIERVVTDSSGLKVRVHAFVITLALALSLATAPTVGVTPAITHNAHWWALSAVLVGTLQGTSLLFAHNETLRSLAAVVTSMLCFAVSFMTFFEAPTSFVAFGFLSLGLCCVLPTLRPFFG